MSINSKYGLDEKWQMVKWDVSGSVTARTSVAAKTRKNQEEAEILVYDQGRKRFYSVCTILCQNNWS